MKKISILGSTGSIGVQALEIIENNKEKFKAVSLSCEKNVELLKTQIEKFKPEVVSVAKARDALELSRIYSGTEFFYGRDGLKKIYSMENCDIVLNALMGIRGLEPTLSAIHGGKNVALANKETLVAGGEIVMDAVKTENIGFLPVDSEHSAIFQCLNGNRSASVRKIILTASGGPFRGYSAEQLENVTVAQALNHPNWSMGKKITVDSATMMNKGLEVIEAKWLFDIEPEKIEVVIHPESILHSAVEYEDGAIIGQMGSADMRIPISYALSFPERLACKQKERKHDAIKFPDIFPKMSFSIPDTKVFKTLDLAYEAIQRGGSFPAVLNGANEVLVEAFLMGRIKFKNIQEILERVMNEHEPVYDLSLESILEEDKRVRKRVRDII